MSTHSNLGDHRRTKENSLVPLETIVELIESHVGPVQREQDGAEANHRDAAHINPQSFRRH